VERPGQVQLGISVQDRLVGHELEPAVPVARPDPLYAGVAESAHSVEEDHTPPVSTLG
jgi:hypothetical protein